MSQMSRIYQINQMLGTSHCVSRRELLERLEVSPATLKRDLAYMRDRLNTPIIYDHHEGGYRLDQISARVGPQYELPGLWFSAEEIHALLTMLHLLGNLDAGGLLGSQIDSMQKRLIEMIGAAHDSVEEVKRRVRIETVGARRLRLEHFQVVGSALLRRRRLLIRYHARGTNEITEREISPQRLVHYRENWYLDAWCHLRNGLRAFSVDAIEKANVVEGSVKDVAVDELNKVLGSGYGIFSGAQVSWARLRFTPERSRWVAAERWHENQQARFLPDGSFELEVPYADDRELLMDILKYGGECEVMEPESLRQRVIKELRSGLAYYS